MVFHGLAPVAIDQSPCGLRSSPILADGKLLGVVKNELWMWEANPNACKVLGKAKIGVETCTSPTLVDGILYLRLQNHVAAYDLREKP